MGKQNKTSTKIKRAYQSPAVASDIWEPRDGKDRPTDQRRLRGRFVLRDTEDAGVTVAVDTEATILDQLRERGLITSEQCQGGLDFAALMDRTRMVSGGRSCLDFTPVGHDDSPPTHAELRDNEERAELYLACGTFTWAELRRVCHENQIPSDMTRLTQGLDICAKFWGLRN